MTTKNSDPPAGYAPEQGVDTLAIHAGQAPDPLTGAVAPPIYQTSTFAFDTPAQGARRFAGTEAGYIYTRIDNPTTRMLEDCVAALERGTQGLATATGMAAVCTVFFSLLRSGDHVVATETLYGPSRLVLENDFARFGVGSTFVDTGDLDAVERAFRPETKLLFLETPANPTLRLADLAACSALAARRGALVAVDNTFASPVLQRPLEHGAQITLHSTTKHINGHSDVVGGVIVARDPALLKTLRRGRTYLGGTMDPHQSWLTLRGLKTLPMRIRTSQQNAIHLAQQLEGHPAVARVFYPGLPSHPQFELARRQMDGPGSVIAFELKGGYDAGVTLLESLQLMILAVSLGGVETLIEHPASMTHAGLGAADLEACGITAGLVRLAVGCESADDLAADLARGLDAVR
jgi:methionine-gamma-lyase